MDRASIATLLTEALAIEAATAALIGRIVSLAFTALVLVVVYRVLIGVIERLIRRAPRARTLGSLLVNVTRWVFGFVILVIVLRELGIDVQALLVSAGLVGLVVGLGAQPLIRDLIAGLFVLFEGLVSVGDLVELGGQRGTVEGIGLRVTRIRLQDGSLRVVPNGQLTDFVNHSAAPWARATVDVGVPKDLDLESALALLARVGQEWAEATGAALERPEAHGIMRITGGEMVLRLMVKVDPARRFAAEVELRRRIKDAFDREGWAVVTSP